MKINKSVIGEELYFIVEEGQFNLGNFENALMMIDLASRTGANAIEFQLSYADDFYLRSEEGHKIYKGREFSDEQLKILVDYTLSKGLDFIATCLSDKLIPKMAHFGASAFNLNASDINNSIILDLIVSTNIPFFISCPLATKEEISWAVARVLGSNTDASFALLHGQHTMASGHDFVSLKDTSLGVIRSLAREFNLPVGFIDHTNAIYTPSIATAAGAKIISKHMTPSKVYKGPDWPICLEPEEMRVSIDMARDVFSSIENTDKSVAAGEDLDRTVMRRSVVSIKEIRPGETLSWENVGFKRPGTGVSPDQAERLIGKKAKVKITEDSLINFNMIENE